MNTAPSNFPAGSTLELPSFPDASSTADRYWVVPSLLQLWHTALRWRWVVVGSIVGTVLLGLIVTLLLPTYYEAIARIEINRTQKQITNVQGLDQNTSTEDLEFYSTQYALLVARPVIERVASQLNLYENQAFFDAHGISPEDAYKDQPYLDDTGKRQAVRRMVIKVLAKHVIVDPVRTSRLVDIGYSSRSPELSTAIANAWTGAFIRVSMDRQVASTADARQILEDRLSALRKRVEESERAVITYAADKDIVNLDRARDDAGRTIETRTLNATNLEALNVALNTARAARVLAESRRTGNGSDTVEAVNSPALAALTENRAELQSQYARLLIQFEPTYPTAVALREQISALDKAIGAENARIARSRQAEYVEAVRRENALVAQVETAKQKLDSQQRASIQFAVLQRERDTNRQLYDALLQRYKEIGVAGNVGISNISVVEPAVVPSDPSFPNIPLAIALSLLVGTVLAAGVVYALEHVDEGVREPRQVPQLLGIPLLGYTPLEKEEAMELLRDSKSEYFDANFSIYTNLALATADGFPRTLTVASTRPNEGKSSVTLALSVIAGRLGHSVLLVDGDLRSPTVHSLFEMDHEVGLSNVLTGERGWKSAVRPTDFKGVSVVTAGPIPPNAAELLSGNRLAQFLAEASQEFDHIIIDSPPVLGLSDGPTLARAVEGCVYVVEANGAPVRAIATSIERLLAANIKVFGGVLTKFDQQRDASTSGYGYGYSYGQPSSGKLPEDV